MVTATDEMDLQRQMEKAEVENAEVAGDDDDEDDDEGDEKGDEHMENGDDSEGEEWILRRDNPKASTKSEKYYL